MAKVIKRKEKGEEKGRDKELVDTSWNSQHFPAVLARGEREREKAGKKAGLGSILKNIYENSLADAGRKQ